MKGRKHGDRKAHMDSVISFWAAVCVAEVRYSGGDTWTDLPSLHTWHLGQSWVHSRCPISVCQSRKRDGGQTLLCITPVSVFSLLLEVGMCHRYGDSREGLWPLFCCLPVEALSQEERVTDPHSEKAQALDNNRLCSWGKEYGGGSLARASSPVRVCSVPPP